MYYKYVEMHNLVIITVFLLGISNQCAIFFP